MEQVIITKKVLDNQNSDIRNMLIRCDKEFVPPLSTRKDTHQLLFTPFNVVNNLDAYFYELFKQVFILLYIDSSLMGMMSFQNKVILEELDNNKVVNFITTVCVEPSYRNKGVLTSLYYNMIYNLPAQLETSDIITRTWSTNSYHIKVLQKFSFEKSLVITDHRGRGIDTIYFSKCY